MELVLSSELTYVPKFGGNRKMPAAEQIVAIYRAPTMSMKKRLLPRPNFTFNYDSAGNVKGGEVSIGLDSKPLIDGMLIRLTNARWKDGDEVHEITDAKSLYEAPVQFDELVEELADHFRAELDKKYKEKN
jgi:hypothetical protein